MHKIQGFNDHTKSFLVLKMLEGVSRQGKKKDLRARITLEIVIKLLSVLPHVCTSAYEASLFKAAFSLAFFGFLRVEEFTSKSKFRQDTRPFHLNDIKIFSVGKTSYVQVTITESKTDQKGLTSTLTIAKHNSIVCPIVNRSNYLHVRPSVKTNGQLFIHFDGTPLTRYQVSSILKKCLDFCNIKNDYFRSHSFRIGGASEAASKGVPDETIKTWGRWRSGAYASYIRTSAIINLN